MRLSQLLLAGLHITEKVDGQPGTLPTATALDTSPICQDSWGLLDPCQAQRGFLPTLETYASIDRGPGAAYRREAASWARALHNPDWPMVPRLTGLTSDFTREQ